MALFGQMIQNHCFFAILSKAKLLQFVVALFGQTVGRPIFGPDPHKNRHRLGRLALTFPYHPCNVWPIYLHEWLIFLAFHVGKPLE